MTGSFLSRREFRLPGEATWCKYFRPVTRFLVLYIAGVLNRARFRNLMCFYNPVNIPLFVFDASRLRLDNIYMDTATNTEG